MLITHYKGWKCEVRAATRHAPGWRQVAVGIFRQQARGVPGSARYRVFTVDGSWPTAAEAKAAGLSASHAAVDTE